MSDLGMLEGQRSLSMLAKHDLPAVRKQVIEIMGRSAQVAFRPDVIYAMSDKSTSVQLAAFGAIESIAGDPAAVIQARSIPANSRAAFWKEWQRNLLQRR